MDEVNDQAGADGADGGADGAALEPSYVTKLYQYHHKCLFDLSPLLSGETAFNQVYGANDVATQVRVWDRGLGPGAGHSFLFSLPPRPAPTLVRTDARTDTIKPCELVL